MKEGKDHTLFAVKAGIVVFQKNKYEKKVNSLFGFENSAFKCSAYQWVVLTVIHKHR